ncbi:MAG TPA: response regulator transcription factor [Chromatiaceae bacterium]|nr:response regulator transcription factor [Chromatiaceae bacterium]
MGQQTRVLLVDKHKLLFGGIEQTIAQTNDLFLTGMVVAEEAALAMCRRYEPDVLLLGLNALNRSFAETIDDWQQHCARLKALVLLTDPDETCIRTLLDEGANGCFLKEEPPARLPEAVRAIIRGEIWLSRPLVEKLAMPLADSVDLLTEREQVLLRLIALEKTDREIAEALHLSERTVRRSLQRLYGKLGVNGRTGAAYEAGRQGLLDDSF